MVESKSLGSVYADNFFETSLLHESNVIILPDRLLRNPRLADGGTAWPFREGTVGSSSQNSKLLSESIRVAEFLNLIG